MFYKNGKYLQQRAGNGRFQHATTESLFGLSVAICPHCGALNPYDTYVYDRSSGFVERKRNDPPSQCGSCGKLLESSK